MLLPDTINGIPVLCERQTDLAIIVRHTIDSPRTGKFISELSDIKRSVPDPALFKAPDGCEMRIDPPPPPSELDELMRDIKPVLPPSTVQVKRFRRPYI